VITETETRRILWRCRRGLLELDLVLGRFVREHCSRLTPQQTKAFEQLLENSDNDLWELIAAPGGNRDASGALLELLRGGEYSFGKRD
jgi:antitoxin CptB